MKKLINLKGVQSLSKSEQKKISGGAMPPNSRPKPCRANQDCESNCCTGPGGCAPVGNPDNLACR